MNPISVICSDDSRSGSSSSSDVLNHMTSPFQYSFILRLGVPPFSTLLHMSFTRPTLHPSGISPSSESTMRSGNRSAISGGRPVSRPSILARTGSKSTNQDLKSARAIASSVSFIRRFSSILSSRVPRMWAMARCSRRGGNGRSNLGMSAHLRLSNTAPTFRYFSTCSHHLGPRIIQRRNGLWTRVLSARRRTRFWPNAKRDPLLSTCPVSPGLHLRERTTSYSCGLALLVHSMKSLGAISRALSISMRPSLTCGMPTYGRPWRAAAGVRCKQSIREMPASCRVAVGQATPPTTTYPRSISRRNRSGNRAQSRASTRNGMFDSRTASSKSISRSSAIFFSPGPRSTKSRSLPSWPRPFTRLP